MNPFFMYEKRQGIEEVFDCNICIEGFRSADDHFDKSRKEHKEASINIYESTPFLTTIDLTTMFIRWFHNYQNSITLQLRVGCRNYPKFTVLRDRIKNKLFDSILLHFISNVVHWLAD